MRRSGTHQACWPAVGGQRRSVVDTWTTRPPCTATAVRPPPLPWLPPVRPHAVCTTAGPYDGSRTTCDGGIGERPGQRRLRMHRPVRCPAGVGGFGPASGRISPTCAHSWGQLLDVSTGSLVADESLSRRNWASAVHGVAHNCGQRHVDVVPAAGGRPHRWCATGRAERPVRRGRRGAHRVPEANR